MSGFIRGGSGTGPGSKFGTEWIIDALRGSQRSSLSPWDHSDINGNQFGFYSIAQASGATVSLGAAAHAGSLRNAAGAGTALFVVPIRIRAGWVVTGAVTAATPMDLQLVLASGYTVEFTTNSTAGTPSKARRGSMATATAVPRILTTAAMSGQTLTADANAYAMTAWTNQPSGNATVTQAVGVTGPMQIIYELTPGYQHPIVLAPQEGCLLQPVTAAVVTGTVKYYFQWEWAELAVF